MTTTSQTAPTAVHDGPAVPVNSKWVVLTNTTIGILLATINSSIIMIALPDIFRGLGISPLDPGNSGYLLWLMMGYLVVTAVLVVSFGRLGDLYGRVRMYNLGFLVFTVCSILLTATWMTGSAGAMWLIVMRILQGVGGALLMANSSAIITDAFPSNQRGMALGLNQVAGIAGSFLGLIIGGLLAPVNWRLVFFVSVPIGVFGTVWAYLKLHENAVSRHHEMDWLGNITFAAGLISVLVAITYGIQPYGSDVMGWRNPAVLVGLIGGVIVLIGFVFIERRVPHPMFRLELFRIRAFTAGNIASLLAALGRGGLMFVLIIWLQGIWLPLHGYPFEATPLWAGIFMAPMSAGFLLAGPASGWLSDRHGARVLASGGMLLTAASFVMLLLLPVDFDFTWFAVALFLNGVGNGLFASPNRAAIMNSLPANRRGVGAGMLNTFQNAAMVLSIGIFFSLMILGLSANLPSAMMAGLTAHGVPPVDAARLAQVPPVELLFAALLGANPMQALLGSTVLSQLSASNAAALTGQEFFPTLIAAPFQAGLGVAFGFAIVASLIAAGASAMRGGKYVHQDPADELAG